MGARQISAQPAQYAGPASSQLPPIGVPPEIEAAPCPTKCMPEWRLPRERGDASACRPYSRWIVIDASAAAAPAAATAHSSAPDSTADTHRSPGAIATAVAHSSATRRSSRAIGDAKVPGQARKKIDASRAGKRKCLEGQF